MQIFSPAIIAAGALSAVVGYALPDIQRVIDPPPVTVHRLPVLPGPCVVQAWTIHADGVVFYVACAPAFRRFATWYWRSDQSTHLSQDFVQAE
jgi:hypothetical protein